MTQRDFEFIASILAEAETMIHEAHGDIGADRIRNFIRQRFEDELAKRHPRFDRGRFDVAASPIANAELRQRIIDSLNK